MVVVVIVAPPPLPTAIHARKGQSAHVFTLKLHLDFGLLLFSRKKEESDTRSLTDSLKRIRDEDKNSAENGGLSKNKLKKLRRNPSKRFEPKTQKFEKCEGCGNPKVGLLLQ